MPGQEFTADDDRDAMDIARLMTAAGQGEVWQAARLVGDLNPNGKSTLSSPPTAQASDAHS